MIPVLHLAARHGRVCLVAGLLAGLLLPALAAVLRDWLPQLVALLLFLNAFRIGPRRAVGGLRDLGRSAGLVLLLQCALPLGLVLALMPLGLAQAPLAVALVLMLSAPSITGSPNFTVMLGRDPAPAMRLLILGTGLVPLTVLPVLLLSPALGEVQAVVLAALRLFAVIAASVLAAFALRAALPPALSDRHRDALDGASSILLGVLVVGLMAALGPALRTEPWTVAGWLAVAVAANFGLQLATHAAMRGAGHAEAAVPVSIVAGNRNIALFLVALPPAVTDPLLIFIGCYQVPMYLTPILLTRLYGRRAPA
ncbi:hypothetical protein GE300_12460 [Rhodobacteraceae bacterium 2CG4]|uniref:BASS family bile acid:Na+ symporter n=1 Tax=Halovulum marinum TaxID=2662447 RepID=A0A6L5Z2W7_9RHOB|nr:hypothetical protein [Halovulum marinum]MSU90420.1 hypothetical protein [Halovulum marinum]